MKALQWSNSLGLNNRGLAKRFWPFAFFGLTALVAQSVNPYYAVIVNTVLIMLTGVFAYNALFGNAGQVALGAGAFLGIGAFVAVGASLTLHLPFWLSLIAAGAVSCLVGVLVAIPSLRLSSHYLIFSTLALNFVVFYVLSLIQTSPTGWTLPTASIFGVVLGTDPYRWITVNAAVAAIAAFLVYNLLCGYPGRAWSAIREHPGAAAIMGVNVVRWRVGIFALSGFFFGLEGALNSYYLGQVSSQNYTLDISITYAIIVLIGGLGSMLGSILGTVTVVALPYLLQNLLQSGALSFLGSSVQVTGQAYLSLFAYGLLVVIILMFEPGGVADAVTKLGRLLLSLARRVPAGGRGRVTPTQSGRAAVTESVDKTVVFGSVTGRSPLLRVRDLVVRYGSAEAAIESISMDVHEGAITAILGPNGAGKTSFLRGVVGFLPGEKVTVSASERSFAGHNLRRHRATALSQLGIAFVPERDKVFGTLSVASNLRLRLPLARHQREEMIREIEQTFPRLKDLDWSKPAGVLSGGERQMLALAMALAGKPRCLVLDEPSLGLAPIAIRQLAVSLRRLRDEQGVTILTADQNAVLALEIADLLCVLNRGRILVSGVREEWSYERLRDAYLTESRQGSQSEVSTSAANSA